jgi:hypothetical protein
VEAGTSVVPKGPRPMTTLPTHLLSMYAVSYSYSRFPASSMTYRGALSSPEPEKPPAGSGTGQQARQAAGRQGRQGVSVPQNAADRLDVQARACSWRWGMKEETAAP